MKPCLQNMLFTTLHRVTKSTRTLHALISPLIELCTSCHENPEIIRASPCPFFGINTTNAINRQAHGYYTQLAPFSTTVQGSGIVYVILHECQKPSRPFSFCGYKMNIFCMHHIKLLKVSNIIFQFLSLKISNSMNFPYETCYSHFQFYIYILGIYWNIFA